MSAPTQSQQRRKKDILRFSIFTLCLLAIVASLICYLWPIDRDNLFPFHERNGKLGMINANGRVVIEPTWEEIAPFDAHGLAMVKGSSGYGCIDRNGNVVVEAIYDSRFTFDSEGMAKVMRGVHFGWINTKGEVIIEPKWLDVGEFDDSGYASVKTVSGWGAINRKGEMMIPDTWKSSLRFDSEGMAVVSDGSKHYRKFGYIDTEGNTVIPFRFSETRGFDSNGLARAKVGGRWGWINRSGDFAIPPRWVSADSFDSAGMARVSDFYGNRTVWGWIDSEGEVVIEPKWDHATTFEKNGHARVTEMTWGGDNPSKKIYSYSIIDRKGEVVKQGLSALFFPYQAAMVGFLDIGHLRDLTNGFEDPATVPKWSLFDEFNSDGLAYALPIGDQHLGVSAYYDYIAEKGRQGKWIDKNGKVVISLPDEGWSWVSPELEGGIASYAAISDAEVPWLREYYLKAIGWINGDSDSVDLTETAFIIFDPEGNVHWDNRWMRFETKCLVVIGVALLMAMIGALGLRKQK